MSESETVRERARKVVTEWDHNNGICLLADHENDLIDRIVAAQSESPRETETVLRLRLEAIEDVRDWVQDQLLERDGELMQTRHSKDSPLWIERMVYEQVHVKLDAALAEPRKGGEE